MSHSNTKFIMLEIYCNFGTTMSGKYFVQYTGNQQQISKFLKINTNGDYVKYYPKHYTYDQVMVLLDFGDLFQSLYTEYFIFTGKMNVPGENKEYTYDDLEEWWETYLGSTKYPQWSNIVESVIDLTINY